ncbi:MAG: hypothetical protein KAY32_15345 [Candidatus Eisenbacteria sp.]|nr:hypothetical protein [Candidatus Eisenbacteria bacterium]
MATEEQTALNGGGFTGIWSSYPRRGQRLTISDREVTKLGFFIGKVAGISGDVDFKIRSVSDDGVLLTKLWGDAADLPTDPAYKEVTFDSPATINEEVRITVEFSGGSSGNYVKAQVSAADVKADEVYSLYSDSWADDSDKDLLYIYTFTGDEPTVTTQAMTDIVTTTATGNGNVTALGDPSPTQHGHCWNTLGTPTISDNKTALGAKATVGAFTSSLTGLTEGTKYFVRAYATNSEGTSYGAEIAFTAGTSGSGISFPVDDVARVSSIRHICTPGSCRMQIGLGDLGFDVDVAEATVRKALDTAKELQPIEPVIPQPTFPPTPLPLAPTPGSVPTPPSPEPPPPTPKEKIIERILTGRGPTTHLPAPAPSVPSPTPVWQPPTAARIAAYEPPSWIKKEVLPGEKVGPYMSIAERKAQIERLMKLMPGL